MNEQTIKAILEQAVDDLYEDQPNLAAFTSETGQTEWNLAHHLASEIHKYFAWFDCDLDVTKRSSGNRRPDIILHRRGINDFNFLVIEVKYDRSQAAIDEDVEKINSHWFGRPLFYEFGAVIHLKRDESCDVTVFRTRSDESAQAVPAGHPPESTVHKP